jgi:hypothetical protein
MLLFFNKQKQKIAVSSHVPCILSSAEVAAHNITLYNSHTDITAKWLALLLHLCDIMD